MRMRPSNRGIGRYGRSWKDTDPVGYRASEGWNKPEPKEWQGPGWVYFIQCGDAIKIGYSVDPRKRLDSMQVGQPEKLELVGMMAGTRESERILHHHFRRHRIRGEWFGVAILPAVLKLLEREFGQAA